jgi:hypothetical protein
MELAMKRPQLGLLEKSGHDSFDELDWLVDNEASSVRLPRYNMVKHFCSCLT